MPASNFHPAGGRDPPVPARGLFFKDGQCYPPWITVLYLMAQANWTEAQTTQEPRQRQDCHAWHLLYAGQADLLSRRGWDHRPEQAPE